MYILIAWLNLLAIYETPLLIPFFHKQINTKINKKFKFYPSNFQHELPHKSWCCYVMTEIKLLILTQIFLKFSKSLSSKKIILQNLDILLFLSLKLFQTYSTRLCSLILVHFSTRVLENFIKLFERNYIQIWIKTLFIVNCLFSQNIQKYIFLFITIILKGLRSIVTEHISAK